MCGDRPAFTDDVDTPPGKHLGVKTVHRFSGWCAGVGRVRAPIQHVQELWCTPPGPPSWMEGRTCGRVDVRSSPLSFARPCARQAQAAPLREVHRSSSHHVQPAARPLWRSSPVHDPKCHRSDCSIGADSPTRRTPVADCDDCPIYLDECGDRRNVVVRKRRVYFVIEQCLKRRVSHAFHHSSSSIVRLNGCCCADGRRWSNRYAS